METKDIINSLQKAIETNGVDLVMNGSIDKQGLLTITSLSVVKKTEDKDRKCGF